MLPRLQTGTSALNELLGNLRPDRAAPSPCAKFHRHSLPTRHPTERTSLPGSAPVAFPLA